MNDKLLLTHPPVNNYFILRKKNNQNETLTDLDQKTIPRDFH